LLLLFMAALPLLLGSCARHDSDLEREAEINRRVMERLVTEHQAQEKQRIAQRETELANREKALVDRESSFATMSASLAPEPLSSSADAEAAPATDDSANTAELANYPVSGAAYPEQYGYASPTEPDFVDDPYFYASSIPLVTVINQNARFVYFNRRPFRMGRGRNQPGFAPAGFRGTGMMPRITGRTPTPVISRRPTAPAVNRPVLNQRRSAPRGMLTATR